MGFAEADPTADVEGHDVQAKIALLAKVRERCGGTRGRYARRPVGR